VIVCGNLLWQFNAGLHGKQFIFMNALTNTKSAGVEVDSLALILLQEKKGYHIPYIIRTFDKDETQEQSHLLFFYSLPIRTKVFLDL
jgi:hypothetical protein